MPIKKAVSITVQGKVQGVGFRYFIKSCALRLELKGYVKNQPDGSVYIEAEGEERKLKILIEKCKQGPILSQVRDVAILASKIQNYSNFVIEK